MAENNQEIKDEELQQKATADNNTTPNETEVKAEAQDAEATETQDTEAETAETEATKTQDAEAETVEAETVAEPTPLEKAQTEIEELKKQMLYKQAEFENFRKRTLKEKADLILNGGEKTIKTILPVLDDFERAMQQAEKTDDVAALKEGMELIFKKFIDILKKEGVEKIDTTDKDFDTDLHEAVALVPGMGDDKKGKVIDCIQTGYTLNNKVIRHAKVAVGQ